METKVCKDCKGTINAEARICPHCQGAQNVLDRFFSRNTTATIFQALVWPAIFVWFLLWVQDLVEMSDVIYAPDDIIEVANVEMLFGEDTTGRKITVIGALVNSSDEGFEYASLNVELYDEAGQLIDVLNRAACAVVLPPEGSSTFRVSGKLAVDKQLYHSAKVVVKSITRGG